MTRITKSAKKYIVRIPIKKKNTVMPQTEDQNLYYKYLECNLYYIGFIVIVLLFIGTGYGIRYLVKEIVEMIENRNITNTQETTNYLRQIIQN